MHHLLPSKSLGLFLCVFLSVALSACATAAQPESADPSSGTSENRAKPIQSVNATQAEAISTDSGDPISLPDTPFADLLSYIPDTSETREREIYLGDYALLRETFEIPSLAPNADEEDIVENFVLYQTHARVGHSFPIGGHPTWAATVENNRKYLRLNISQIDQTAVVLNDGLTISKGRYSAEETNDGIRSCAECLDPTVLEEHLGVPFYSWGEEGYRLRRRYAPPVGDHYGRGGRLMVSDNYVLYTNTTIAMRNAIASAQGKAPSLADAEDFRLLLLGLDKSPVHGAGLITDTPIATIDSIAMTWNGLELESPRAGNKAVEHPLLPYQAIAIGWGNDQIGEYVTMVIVHSDTAGATQNVEPLNSLLGLVESISDSELQSEGRLIIAKLRSEDTRQLGSGLLSSAISGEGLLAHE